MALYALIGSGLVGWVFLISFLFGALPVTR
jgi:hypothetical protein